MLKARLLIAFALTLPSCAHAQPQHEWLEKHYTLGGADVRLWDDGPGTDCIQAIGPPHVVKSLQSFSDTGRARFLLERLPDFGPEPPMPPDVIIYHHRVRVRGVPVERFCDSGELYWILNFEYLGPAVDSVPD